MLQNHGKINRTVYEGVNYARIKLVDENSTGKI